MPGCLKRRQVRHPAQRHGTGSASAGGNSRRHFFGERRRRNSILGTRQCLRGDADAAEVPADVKGCQGLAAEGVAEAVGVAEGVQEAAK